jgi:hypothetical protein
LAAVTTVYAGVDVVISQCGSARKY